MRVFLFAVIIYSLILGSAFAQPGLSVNNKSVTNMNPTISVSMKEKGVFEFSIDNQGSRDIQIDLSSILDDVRACVSLQATAHDGSSLTTNNIFKDGFWSPWAMTSQVFAEETYRSRLVTLAPRATIRFHSRASTLLSGLKETDITAGNIASVRAKLVYWESDKERTATSQVLHLKR